MVTAPSWLDPLYDWLTRQSWPDPAYTGSTFWSAGPMTRPVDKCGIHSTETQGWPGYHNDRGQAGANAPHVTLDLRTGEARQHVSLDHGARAHEVRATNQANTGGVVQVEFIGAVTPGYPELYGHYDLVNAWPTDARAQFYVARLFAAFLAAGLQIPMVTTVTWRKFPDSWGDQAPQRLTVAAWLAYRGVHGHQHVPGNNHGDPGQLVGLPAVLALAGRVNPTHTYEQHLKETQPVSPTPDENGYLPEEYGTIYQIARVQTALAALGFYTGPVRGGIGPMTEAAIRDFQGVVFGLPVNGKADAATTTALTLETDVVAVRAWHAKDKADALAARDKAHADATAKLKTDHAAALAAKDKAHAAAMAAKDTAHASALAAAAARLATEQSARRDAEAALADALAASEGSVTAMARANAILTAALAAFPDPR